MSEDVDHDPEDEHSRELRERAIEHPMLVSGDHATATGFGTTPGSCPGPLTLNRDVASLVA